MWRASTGPPFKEVGRRRGTMAVAGHSPLGPGKETSESSGLFHHQYRCPHAHHSVSKGFRAYRDL